MCRLRPKAPRPGLFSELSCSTGDRSWACRRRTSRAAAAFERAVANDSTDSRALEALSIATATLGDTVRARKALALLQRQRGDSSSDADFGPRWFLAAITGDTAALHRVLRSDSMTSKYGVGRPVGRGRDMIRLGLHQGLDLREAEGVLHRALAAAATQSQRAEIRWNQDVLLAIRGAPSAGRIGQGHGDIFPLPKTGDGRFSISCSPTSTRPAGTAPAPRCCD